MGAGSLKMAYVNFNGPTSPTSQWVKGVNPLYLLSFTNYIKSDIYLLYYRQCLVLYKYILCNGFDHYPNNSYLILKIKIYLY